MQRTWFVSPSNERIVRVECPNEEGATDEEWRSFLATLGIRLKDSNAWGPMARMKFMNWLESNHSIRMTRFFDSKEAAIEWLADHSKQGLVQPDGDGENEG